MITQSAEPPSEPIRLGISSCLLGHEVRYDRGQEHNAYITQTLGRFFEFVPLCPEVAIGLGVPRPPIRLVRLADGVHARGVNNPEQDVSQALVAYGEQVSARLSDVSGCPFKKGSPSCGMERVEIYDPGGMPVGAGQGGAAGPDRRVPAQPGAADRPDHADQASSAPSSARLRDAAVLPQSALPRFDAAQPHLSRAARGSLGQGTIYTKMCVSQGRGWFFGSHRGGRL